MVILGLTGSIGMGKSRAATNFRRAGVPVHDADATVHALLAKGGEAVDAVSGLFPGVVVGGAVDRERVAVEVFGDPVQLARIESVLHPLVRAKERAFLGRAARQRRPLVVLDVPLLFETGGEKRCDGVVTVSAPAFIQERRVLRRRGMTRERLASILERQMPDWEKRRRADFVVHTGLGRGFSLRQILEVVRIANRWQGANWPPRPEIGGNAIA